MHSCRSPSLVNENVTEPAYRIAVSFPIYKKGNNMDKDRIKGAAD